MSAEKLKVAIYGAGAMGTVLGALLSDCASDAEVDLISRNRAHVEGLKKGGAHVVCTASASEFTVTVNALLPEEMQKKYDVVFLMTKQKSNAETVKYLSKYLSEDGIVCTTQNGLPEASVAAVIGADRTYGAAVAWGATFVGAGTVELTSSPEAMTMEIGSYSGRGDKLRLLKELLESVGTKTGNKNFVKVTDNLMGGRWSKLAINAAFSGLSVVTGLTFGEIAEKRKTRKLALGILRECFAVARAAGIKLESMQGHDMEKLLGKIGLFGTQAALFILPIAMKKHKGLVSGMLKDVQKGKKCEIDYIDGAVCREGERYGVDTPLCGRVVELVHGIENGLYEISFRNVDFF